MHAQRLHRLALVLVGIGVGLGCSLVTKPNDNAERCETQEDCDQPSDARYQTVCQFGDEHQNLDPADVDMICVAAFKDITCDSTSYPEGNLLRDTMDGLKATDYASPCVDDKVGAMGCPGPCQSGLSLNDNDVCDDDDSSTPPAVKSSTSTNVGQDVLDQFCRSIFCDQDFVCDTDGYSCKLCDKSKPYGTGGCGDLYVDGARACHYRGKSQVEGDDCKAPDVDTDAPTFGSCG